MFRRFDSIFFYVINRNCSNAVFDFLMPWVTDLADGTFLFLLGLILLFFNKKEGRKTGLLLLAGLTLSYNIVYFLKTYTAYPRPFDILTGINVLIKEKGFSFPSGHTARAFMSAFLLGACFKRHVLFYALALLVGISRVYIGVHYPSDVIAGALLGIAIGYLLWRTAKNA